MRTPNTILKEIERSLVAQKERPEEIRRILALPPDQLQAELRRRRQALLKEAAELEDFAQQKELGIENPTGPMPKA